MSIILDGTNGIVTPDIDSGVSTLGPLTQALNLGSTGQIVFPTTQNPSANASTLDDYEEGTWLPTLVPTSGGPITVRSNNSVCWYVKIGRVVHFGGRINVDVATSPSGDLRLGNFPFPPAPVPNGSNQISFSVAYNFLASALNGPVSFFWLPGDTFCRLRDNANSTGPGSSMASRIGSSTNIFINGSYLVSA